MASDVDVLIGLGGLARPDFGKGVASAYVTYLVNRGVLEGGYESVDRESVHNDGYELIGDEKIFLANHRWVVGFGEWEGPRCGGVRAHLMGRGLGKEGESYGQYVERLSTATEEFSTIWRPTE
jgi:hypothetical protein